MSTDNPHGFPETLTPSQWLTLYAFTSAVISPLEASQVTSILGSADADLSKEHIESFLLSAADHTNARFRHALELKIEGMPTETLQGFTSILNLLNSLTGSLLVTSSTTPFHRRTLPAREALISSWLDPSSCVLLPGIRQFAKSTVDMAIGLWARTADPDMFYGAVGYPEKTGAGVREVEGEQAGFYRFEFIDFEGEEEKEGNEDGKEEEVKEVKCEVVVVGSGCGGAVAAARLAKEGFDVVVVDRGVWVPSDQLPLREVDAFSKLFHRGLDGSATVDRSIAVVAGETFGGGGVVNWAASLQTQGYVREEWATEHNLPFFLSGDYQNCLDTVCERMGVTTNTSHNHRNATLLEGCRKLGYSSAVVPQNTGARIEGDGDGDGDGDDVEVPHLDGYCSNGCGSGKKGQGRKMGTTQTWLPDAAKAGARFIQTYRVDKVLFADHTNTTAVGVTGTWGARHQPLKITAKKVIISAGSLHSPCLLLRSGLTNPNIGHHLHLHPVLTALGYFRTRTDPWLGSALTSICTSFEALSGTRHGSKLETASMGPLLVTPSIPWRSSPAFKRSLLRYRHSGMFFALQRDSGEGRVEVGPDGEPAIDYSLAEPDRRMLNVAVGGLAKILYVQGAEEIVPAMYGLPPFKRRPTESEREEEIREEVSEAGALGGFSWSEPGEEEDEREEGLLSDPGITDERFSRWLRKLSSHASSPEATLLISAHQMSSCRMGSDGGAASVVDPRGRVWGVDGLLVADASVMPSASGVNPMITTMAIAEWIARGVGKELRGGKGLESNEREEEEK